MTGANTSQFSYDPYDGLAARGLPPPQFGQDARPPTLYQAGAEIYAQGERCGSLYKIEFGAVRIYRLLSDGRRQISAFHFAGEMFGFEADNIHHFFAEAICGTGIRTLRTAASKGELAIELLPMALQGLVRAQEHLLVLGRRHRTHRRLPPGSFRAAGRIAAD